MKKLLFILLSFLLLSCNGNETYRGNWKAMDLNGEKFILTFEAMKLRIIKKNEQQTFSYTQNGISNKNGVKKYKIVLEDDREYDINFPFKNDLKRAVISNNKGIIIYIIGRDQYISYDEIISD